jgi:membrane dipeptidase
MHSQGVDLIKNDVNLLDTFKALGVGVMQLAYNEKNRLGDGPG